MKRLICSLCLLAMSLSACGKDSPPPVTSQPASTSATAATDATIIYTTYYVVNCEESIAMYSSPDLGSSLICTIPFGSGVSYIQNVDNGFCQIAYQGSTGYALAACLSFTAPSQTEKYVTYYVVNCLEYITLRSAPSTEASALCHIPLGAAVSCVNTSDNGFLKVIYNGQTGYALASYLSQDPDAHVTPQDSTASTDHTYTTCYVINCKESITLRSAASSNSVGYCQIPLGASLTHLGTASNGFYKVIYNGQTGYVLASYITFSKMMNPLEFCIREDMRVVNCESYITLRAEPSTSAAAYCQIPLGSTVEYLEPAENGFYLISYNGQVGYALANYLSR